MCWPWGCLGSGGVGFWANDSLFVSIMRPPPPQLGIEEGAEGFLAMWVRFRWVRRPPSTLFCVDAGLLGDSVGEEEGVCHLPLGSSAGGVWLFETWGSGEHL